MSTLLPDNDRVLDLLVKQATEGLTDAERRELESYQREHPEAATGSFETTVALLDVSAQRSGPLPQQLRGKILATALAEADITAGSTAEAPMRSARSAASGWWAAAACLVLAVAGWWPRIVGTPVVNGPAPLSAAQERESLLSRENIVRVQLAAASAGQDAALTGDVIFDPVTQNGYMRFRGIPANDPRLTQYQLWIADGARAQPEPVDGGVFDVPSTAANGDVIIPFRAKLAVGAPAAFVVTMEQPGGVVVSRQERVLALGKVDAGA
jgi:hypothetical protein